MATEKETVIRTNSPLSQAAITADGMQVLSGPMPGGQVAQMTQITPKSVDPSPIVFAGVPGGPFTIYGFNFGPVGVVHLGGTQLTVTAWQPHRIKGLLPPGLNIKQEAVVTDGSGVVTKIPYAPPAVPQAVVPEPAVK